ncbi:endoribonuclease YbeY [Dokdonia pacifica]|uniref:Endoribonuclease YbeY n=1 Tax=Dokdonia pacifica TaxID=1627892 RepID=A0A238WFQ7_9FLAO|nr:rRNA maturation RNase YbeY [Dokdonia pacifica]GGG20799.1 endoribonuclease YbeY [Dokdonia pacifica]SNR45267.1 rRNA maturation RNase YbeY [Dokdonia pacifica]
MIEFNTVNDFELENAEHISKWLQHVIQDENKQLGELNYIFCDDEYLHKMNVQFLDHDTLTDVISFDYTQGIIISGDVYISTERVVENSKDFEVSFNDELHRVMVHGLLHYCGYKDKSEDDQVLMRAKENYYLEKR